MLCSACVDPAWIARLPLALHEEKDHFSASSETDPLTEELACDSGLEYDPNLSPTSSQGSERTYYPLQVVAKRLVTITFSDSVNRKGVNTLKHGPV